VRRGKPLDSSGCNSRPETGSLQPIPGRGRRQFRLKRFWAWRPDFGSWEQRLPLQSFNMPFINSSFQRWSARKKWIWRVVMILLTVLNAWEWFHDVALGRHTSWFCSHGCFRRHLGCFRQSRAFWVAGSTTVFRDGRSFWPRHARCGHAELLAPTHGMAQPSPGQEL